MRTTLNVLRLLKNRQCLRLKAQQQTETFYWQKHEVVILIAYCCIWYVIRFLCSNTVARIDVRLNNTKHELLHGRFGQRMTRKNTHKYKKPFSGDGFESILCQNLLCRCTPSSVRRFKVIKSIQRSLSKRSLVEKQTSKWSEERERERETPTSVAATKNWLDSILLRPSTSVRFFDQLRRRFNYVIKWGDFLTSSVLKFSSSCRSFVNSIYWRNQ